MVGFIINENLHVWELEGENLGFRANRKYSTSDAVSQGRSIRLENWSSSDLTEENLEFQKPMDSVFSSRKFPRLCWEMDPPPAPRPIWIVLWMNMGHWGHLSSPSWHHSSHAYSEFSLPGPSYRLKTSLSLCLPAEETQSQVCPGFYSCMDFLWGSEQ